MKEKYYIIRHGLFYIVGHMDNQGMTPQFLEDSRWLDESLAIQHCDILNSVK